MPAHATGPDHRRRGAGGPSHRRRRPRTRTSRRLGVAALAAATATGIAVIGYTGLGGALEQPASTGQATQISTLAEADTYVSYGAPGNIRGTSVRLTAGSTPGDVKVIYLRFRLDAPTGTTVTGAKIRLNRDEHHLSGDVTIHRVGDTSWDERTLGARAAPTVGDAVDTVSTDRSTTSVTFDVSPVVDRSGVYSFAVTAAIQNDVARFRSRETGASGPTLQVALTPSTVASPSGAPTAAPSSPLPTVGPISPTSTPSGSTVTPTPAPTTTSGSGGLVRPNCSVSSILVPSCGRWWGIVPSGFSPDNGPTGLKTAETLAQRPFDVYHAYHVNDQLFPTDAERGIALEAGRNRLLFLNWKPATDMTWRQVADGGADARIDRLAAHIKATFPYKFFLTIWHEPENDVVATAGSGKTAADFAAMFRHTVQRLRADGVSNAVVVMNYMNYSRWNNASWFEQLYPGDDVVDWIGWDPYASGQASGYNSGDFGTLVNRTDGLPFPGFYTWATTTHANKPIMLGEWGIFEDLSNPDGKAKFLNSVSTLISRYPKFKALLYFDTKKDPHGLGDTSLDSSAISLKAFQALSRNPEFIAPAVVAQK